MKTCASLMVALIALSLSAAEGKKKKTELESEFFTSKTIPTFKITIADDQLATLKKDNRKYVRSTVKAGDTVLTNVAIRLKGMGSFQGLDGKPSFAVKFDEFASKQQYMGIEKVMLNNSSQDGTYLAEMLGLGLFRDAGLSCARVTHAYVQLNGRDLGLYVVVEAINKEFLRQHFKSAKGNLYEAYLADIDSNMDQDNGEDTQQTDRKALLEATKITDPAKRLDVLRKLMDVDRFISHIVLEMFTSHTDGYALNRNNYRIYHDPGTDKFVFIAHGIDWAFGNTGVSIWPPMNSILVKAVLQTPEGRATYRERVGQLYTNVFKVDLLNKRIDEAAAKLKAGARNPNEAKAVDGYAAEMRNRITARAKNIADQLALPPPQPLRFDSLGFAQISGWHTRQESTDTKLEQKADSGKNVLSISGTGVASWRTRVLLEPGKYRFQGQAKGQGIAPQDSDVGSGAGLRISGGKRTNKLVGDKDWTALEYDFEVPGAEMEVELVCELRATKGQVWFDASSLRLARAK
ncbi:MAG TPA: CotH kinase family protein [Candidatus Binatia bacterium]|nr:CotH kinase family protein [Candidatus Binatia bacterium]